MIVVGVITSLLGWQLINLGVGAAVFVFLLIGYKFGKIGGGDVKIFTGIALLNPFNDIMFLVNAGFFAAASAMIFYSVYYTIKYARKGINWKENKKEARKALLLAVVLAAYFYILGGMGLVRAMFIYVVGVPFFFGLLFIGLQKGIKRNFFERKVKLKDFEEDEIIAEGRNEGKIEKLLKGKQLLEKKEIALLKKHGVKALWVMRGLPKFGPFIFIGVAIALWQPNLLGTLLF